NQGGGSSGSGAGKQSSGRENEGKGPGSSRSSESFSPPHLLPQFLQQPIAWFLPILKWIVFAIAAVLVAFIVLRAVLQFLANFTVWARGLLEALQGLWNGLFGWWLVPSSGSAAAPEEPPPPPRPPRPFSSFMNPFLSGADSHRSPEELVR